jgi:phage FluMu gp28-like protein
MTAPISQADWEKFRRESMEIMPELAEKLGLPAVLLPYQSKAVRLIDSTAMRVLFIEKSRRIGLTWGLAAYAVLRAGRKKSARGMDVLYISYKQEIAKEFVDVCGMWARAFAVAAADVDEALFDDTNPDNPEDTRQIQAYRIRFASGFQILALSSAPRSLRGQQGDVIIDEAAFVDSLKELMKAAIAMRMWGGKVIVCSTHDGVDNPFNAYVQEIVGGKSKYQHMKVDLDLALVDGLFKRMCLVNGEAWTPEGEARWRQEIIEDYGDGADEELFCIPAMGSGAWLTGALIEARMALSPEEAPVIRIELPADFLHRPELERRHLLEPHLDRVKRAVAALDEKLEHAFGYDPARKVDPAIISLLAIDRLLKRRSALTVEMRNVPFQEQRQIAGIILSGAPRLVGAAIDATGMGMNLAEDLGRDYGLREDLESSGLVWAIKLSVPWYNEHFPPLKTAFEDGSVLLAQDNEHLADLRLVKIIRGVPQVPPEREGETGKKRHGDFAVALALAHFASRMQWHEYGYDAVRGPSAPAGRDRGGDGFWLPDESDDFMPADPFRGPMGVRIRGGL